MKILVPIVSSNSGSEIYFHDLKSGLDKRQIVMELMCFNPFFEFTPGFMIGSVRRRARSEDYDLIHSNADYGVAFRLPTKPYVATVHHNVFDEEYQRCTSIGQKAYHYGLLRKRLAQILGEADRVVAVSHSTKASLERVFGAKNIEVIYNGIDPQSFKPKKVQKWTRNKRVNLLFVGNLIRRKGADLLPEIMRGLGGDYLLSYTGGLRLGKAFNEPNMMSINVKSSDDLVTAYNACDIFLFPSRLEGFGYAVAEAMACARPVICTNVSSLPELVVDHKGGFLCERDNIDDFIEKIRILGENPEQGRRMGAFNRQRIAEHFTLVEMTANYAALYNRVIAA